MSRFSVGGGTRSVAPPGRMAPEAGLGADVGRHEDDGRNAQNGLLPHPGLMGRHTRRNRRKTLRGRRSPGRRRGRHGEGGGTADDNEGDHDPIDQSHVSGSSDPWRRRFSQCVITTTVSHQCPPATYAGPTHAQPASRLERRAWARRPLGSGRRLGQGPEPRTWFQGTFDAERLILKRHLVSVREGNAHGARILIPLPLLPLLQPGASFPASIIFAGADNGASPGPSAGFSP